ncbi:hypothetical protein [Halorubrum californiense]|nr:hypothetical protein [Halorubrum californiense]
MPTFKTYVNKQGYYINARPSDVGNMTYQVDTEAADFILKLGYEHEDELPWGVVKPLRVAGLIYTNQQGVAEDNEDIPELDPSKLASMSNLEQDKLLAYLDGRGDIDDRVIENLRSQIGGSKDDAEILTNAIEDELERSVEVEISRVEGSDGGYGNATINIEIEPLAALFTDGMEISHRIEAASSPGVDEWEITHGFGEGWESAAKAAETKIPIMKAFAEVSDQLSFEFHPYDDGGSFL